MYGGRVAEEMIFQNQTTGASSDIKQATNLVRKLVCDYGMTNELGPLSYGEKDEQIFLGREISRHRDYSDKTAEEIDAVMRTLIEHQLQRSRDILEAHRNELDLLASALLEHELLDRDEIMKVIKGEALVTAKKSRSLLKHDEQIKAQKAADDVKVTGSQASDDESEQAKDAIKVAVDQAAGDKSDTKDSKPSI
jgi:cell division protease FtsH